MTRCSSPGDGPGLQCRFKAAKRVTVNGDARVLCHACAATLVRLANTGRLRVEVEELR